MMTERVNMAADDINTLLFLRKLTPTSLRELGAQTVLRNVRVLYRLLPG